MAGTPTEFEWDDEAGVFTMSWDERAGVTGPTEIAVPAGRFPDGFAVVLDGAEVDEPAWDEETSVLRLEPDRSKERHEVCIAAAGDAGCEA